jgi:hypothetical protein
MTTPNPISVLIDSQIPDFIRAENPSFVAFLNAYYEWLDLQENVNYESRKLLDYSDVDRTTSDFIKYFVTKFLPYFPEEVVSDKSKLIKAIRNFYSEKGNEKSLKFLFRVLYNEDIDVVYPKDNILIASDGKWKLPKSIRLKIENVSPSFDVRELNKRRAFGVDSRASCLIENAYRTIDVGTNTPIIEIFISNIQGQFNNGEILEISYINEQGTKVVLLSEEIIGSLSNIKIDPNYRGLRYKTNDPVVIVGGLSKTDPNTLKARAVVNEVTAGQVQGVGVEFGGYGFSTFPNTVITVINDPNDLNGREANVIVESVDTINAVALLINTDVIEDYKDLTLDSPSFGFG